MNTENKTGLFKGQNIWQTKRLQILDGSIALIAAAVSLFIYQYFTEYIAAKYFLTGVFVVIALYYAGKLIRKNYEPVAAPVLRSDIDAIVMLNENGSFIKEWNIQDKITLLIGKHTKNREVDVDLSASAYEALIHEEHAIMNFAAGSWYLEGLHRPSGISIKKANDRMRYRLVGGRPCKLEPGDILFIANTRLLMK
ncbi:Hypothetical protein LUCI_4306 [Lucifera butyrica]|uniref:FHA domain-containing protein n=1 Tax=Lucifera butyrica TaxID=1351585 RepID=A0A498RDW8_9FIRM|nr:FHA domain-containing protein [Lucifera butyrica]VBB09020.1 Hypothetical protein LUCI_4306 [Lucifera butyrica]